MNNLIKYYYNLAKIINNCDFEKEDEDIMLDILDLINVLIIKEAKKKCVN